jgi:hypothetical protein
MHDFCFPHLSICCQRNDCYHKTYGLRRTCTMNSQTAVCSIEVEVQRSIESVEVIRNIETVSLLSNIESVEVLGNIESD